MEARESQNTIEIPSALARSWCLFEAEGEHYAIDLEHVAEIIEVERLVRIPGELPRVAGFCALRRDVIPVFRLGPLESKAGASDRDPRHVLILKTSRGFWAVLIRGQGILVIEQADENHAPATGPGSGIVVAGKIQFGATEYLVIDPEATWWAIREMVDDCYANYWERDAADRDPAVRAS